MKIETLAIADVKLVTPGIVRDHRGFFSETFNGDAFRRGVGDVAFVQDNHSLAYFTYARGRGD